MDEVAFPLPRRSPAASTFGRRRRGRALEALLVVMIVGIVIHEAVQSFGAVLAKTSILNAISLSRTEHAEAIMVLTATGVLPDRVVERPSSAFPALRPVFGAPEWRDGELVFPATERLLRSLTGDAEDTVGEAAVAFRMARAPVSGATVWLCGTEIPPPGFAAPPPSHTTIEPRYLPHFCR